MDQLLVDELLVDTTIQRHNPSRIKAFGRISLDSSRLPLRSSPKHFALLCATILSMFFAVAGKSSSRFQGAGNVYLPPVIDPESARLIRDVRMPSRRLRVKTKLVIPDPSVPADAVPSLKKMTAMKTMKKPTATVSKKYNRRKRIYNDAYNKYYHRLPAEEKKMQEHKIKACELGRAAVKRAIENGEL